MTGVLTERSDWDTQRDGIVKTQGGGGRLQGKREAWADPFLPGLRGKPPCDTFISDC